MRSITKIWTLLALLIFAASLQAQNPITRRVKGDTIRKKSEVVLTNGQARERGESKDGQQQASFQKQFNDLLNKADDAESFNERKELLLKARGICFDQLKNDCKDLIDDKLKTAYSSEINRLLAKANRENEYNEKMHWLNSARELCEASFVAGSDRSKVQEAFKAEYQELLDKGNNSSYDVDRRMRYFRSALRFCEDYGAFWGTTNCKASIDRNIQRLFDDLLDQAEADPDLDDQKRLLEQAKDLCNEYLQNGCNRTIEHRLRTIYSNSLERILEKARSTRDLKDKLRYYADAEAICREVNAPGDCQERIDQERNLAFNANFDKLLEEITRTDNYDRQQELLKEAERLIAKGQLPDERWEDIRQVKHQVHYRQLEDLLYQRGGSFESQMSRLDQAEAINEHYLSNTYTRKIQERKVVLITDEINSVLRYENRPFQERIDRLDYAEQLTQQLNRRHRYQLLPKIAEERDRIVWIEYDALVQTARTERHLDAKVGRYEEAIRFCANYIGETATRGGCDQLQQERQDVVRDVYQNMIADAKMEMRAGGFEKAMGTLSLAGEVYQKYGNDLINEMPISAAYQQLYNEFLLSAKEYTTKGNYHQARLLLQDAQKLEDGNYWVVGSNNPIQGQLEEIDRLEMDQKLGQLETMIYKSDQTENLLQLLEESCELYTINRPVYNSRHTTRLSQLYNSTLEQSLKKALQDIQYQRYPNARTILVQLKALSDRYGEFGNSMTIKNGIDNGFYQWYAKQMDKIESNLKSNVNRSAATAQLNELYSRMNEDQFVKPVNGTASRMLRLFHEVFDSYQTSILSKLQRDDFNTQNEEQELDVFYRNHTNIFTQEEYDRAKSGISFAAQYEKAWWYQDKEQYRLALDQWLGALNQAIYAPANYQKANLATEIKDNRNAAYAAEINRQLNLIRRDGYQQNRINAYRDLQAFMDRYQLPVSAYVLEDIKSLKEEIFGDICTQRSQQFFFKLESGDDAIRQNNYTAALKFYQEAEGLAAEFPECGIDIGLVRTKIANYEAASVFQQKKMALDQLQDKIYSSRNESDFRAYQNAYQELSDFYNEKIINKGFHLNLVPYQRKVVQIRNNEFWSYVLWTQCTDRSQLSFTTELLSELVRDKSFPGAALDDLAAKMATQNYKVFGGSNYKDTFQYFDLSDLRKNKRFKNFKKAYKKQYKRVS